MAADKPIVIALCGKSASGKDWYMNHLANKYKWNRVVSWTTRPPRNGEVNNFDYCFVDDDAFLAMDIRDDLLERCNFRGWWYGTPKAALDRGVNVGVFNLTGVESLLKHQDTIDVVPVLLECPARLRLSRSIKREGKLKVEMLRRMATDHADFSRARVRAIRNSCKHGLKVITPTMLNDTSIDTTDKRIWTATRCCGGAA